MKIGSSFLQSLIKVNALFPGHNYESYGENPSMFCNLLLGLTSVHKVQAIPPSSLLPSVFSAVL